MAAPATVRPPPLQPTERRAWAIAARRARVEFARRDPSTFCELVLKDEQTGKPIRQAPIHEAWHTLISERQRLVVWAHNESGKTSQISIGRVLWELGKNPSLRIAIVSNTATQARKIVRTIAQYIENSAELHAVFPELKPGHMNAKEPWTESQLAVKRPYISKTPSVQAFGIHGNITGDRIDLMILDDVLDEENTLRSPRLMKDLWDWYTSTLVGRTTDKSRIIVVGTAYHPEDLLHVLARQPAFQGGAVRYPVVDEKGNPRWPERWPLSRVEQRRKEIPPDKFARTMLCEARDDRSSRFHREWIDRCLARGNGNVLMNYRDPATGVADHLRSIPAGCQVYTGVDLAVSKKDAADLTCFFTIMVASNGDRHVLNIEAGRWSAPEIKARIIDHHRRFQSILIVENVGAQDYILQFTRYDSAVPVRPFTTGERNKAFGIEMLAVEFENAKWVIPNDNGVCDPEVDAWVRELLFYDPAAHTGDRLMASLFARDGAHATGPEAPQGEVGRLDLMRR